MSQPFVLGEMRRSSLLVLSSQFPVKRPYTVHCTQNTVVTMLVAGLCAFLKSGERQAESAFF